MKYVAIHREFQRRRPYLGASAAAKGVHAAVSGYAAEIESDRIEGARSWTDREWIATCDVDRAEVDAASNVGLVRWDGDDLVVEGFDHDGLRAVEAKRAAGKFGSQGGRPKKKPSGFSETNPQGDPNGTETKTPSPLLPFPLLPSPNLSKNTDSSALVADDNAKPTAILTFPCGGKVKSWDLTAGQVAEWQEPYPALDILQECRAALSWVQANQKKTAKGMPAFLVAWLSRSQNRAPAPSGATKRDVRVGHTRAEDFAHGGGVVRDF